MPEATHNQIYERIGAVESRLAEVNQAHAETNNTVSRLEERSLQTKAGVDQNRETIQDGFAELWRSMHETNTEQARTSSRLSNVERKLDGIGQGVKGIGWMVGIGLTIVGIVIPAVLHFVDATP